MQRINVGHFCKTRPIDSCGIAPPCDLAHHSLAKFAEYGKLDPSVLPIRPIGLFWQTSPAIIIRKTPGQDLLIDFLKGEFDNMMYDRKTLQPPSRRLPSFHHGGQLHGNEVSAGMYYGTGMNRSSLTNLSAVNGSIEPQKKTWSRRSLCIALGGAILAILTISHLCSALFPIVCRLGRTERADPPSSVDLSTGIGFQLTPAYGVSAIRHQNGTFSNVARVDFNTETVDYQQETFYHMMQRLAESKSYRDPYAGYCHDDNIGVGPPLTRRFLRKVARRLVGLPSTEDVGRLADAIRSLKEKTEETLGHKLNQVILTAPMLNQLCRKDIREAAEYVGLMPLMDPYPSFSHDISAAYVGYGLGICEDYQNLTRCKEEERALPERNTLMVLYTKHVLMVSLHQMQSYRIYEYPYPTYVLEWEGFLTQSRQRNSDAYRVQWQSVALRLAQLPIDDYMPIENVDRVVVMGEGADGEIMALAVERAMAILHQGKSEYELYAEETEFVAARGAAEIAWRRQHGG